MFRIGTGFDIHRLVPGRRLVLCGVDFDFPFGLFGHSDADVPTHALMDALLGAAALGDIGHLFPDTDPEWEGADSIRLLEAVVALLRRKGWRVANADLTILAEAPKIAPHVQEMRERLQRREKELMEERQKAEAERQQHAAAQQALLARLSDLEMGLPGTTNQSREARSVRLAPWMGLKK